MLLVNREQEQKCSVLDINYGLVPTLLSSFFKSPSKSSVALQKSALPKTSSATAGSHRST